MTVAYLSQFNVQLIPDSNDPQKQRVLVKHGPEGLFSGGIVIELAIGVDAVTQSSATEKLPEPIVVMALVDTGCTITSIDKSLVSKLNLKTRGYTTTLTANGAIRVSQHVISIDFPGIDLKGRPIHQVQAVDLSGQEYGVLIGRDIMTAWAITYNGPAGFISISD